MVMMPDLRTSSPSGAGPAQHSRSSAWKFIWAQGCAGRSSNDFTFDPDWGALGQTQIDTARGDVSPVGMQHRTPFGQLRRKLSAWMRCTCRRLVVSGRIPHAERWLRRHALMRIAFDAMPCMMRIRHDPFGKRCSPSRATATTNPLIKPTPERHPDRDKELASQCIT